MDGGEVLRGGVEVAGDELLVARSLVLGGGRAVLGGHLRRRAREEREGKERTSTGREPRARRVDFSATDHRRHPWRLARTSGQSGTKGGGQATRAGDETPRNPRLSRKERARRVRVRGSGGRVGTRGVPERAQTRRIGPPTSLSTHRRGGENARRDERRDRDGEETHPEGRGVLPPFFLDLLGAMLTDGGGGRGVVAARRARAKCGPSRRESTLFVPKRRQSSEKVFLGRLRSHTANVLVHSLEKTMRSVRVRGNMGLFSHTRGC